MRKAKARQYEKASCLTFRLTHGLLYMFVLSSIMLFITSLRLRTEMERLKQSLYSGDTYSQLRWRDAATIEAKLIGRKFPDISFAGVLTRPDLNRQGVDRSMCRVVLVTTFSNCSSCRDRELELWRGPRAKQNFLVLISDPALSESAVRELRKYIRANEYTYVWRYDSSGSVLSHLDLKPQDTPITLLVDRDGDILLAHQAIPGNTEKTLRFQKIVETLIAYHVCKMEPTS